MNGTPQRLSNTTRTAPADGRLEQALEEFYGALDAGTVPPRDKFLAKYADIAGELAPCLDSLEFVENVAPQMDDQQGAPSAPRGPIELGDFRIVREIGRGGMGVVYEAEQLSLARRVALKVLPFASMLDRRQLQRFKTEAQAAAHLRHPNIVGVHAVGCERGVHYYAMELVEGQSLDSVVATIRQEADATGEVTTSDDSDTAIGHGQTETEPAGVLSTYYARNARQFYRSVAEFGVQVADALKYAHQMGVVHRDIKPSNLLVDSDGRPCITDFGLALTQTDSHLTMTGDVLGTLRYMSPEQACGKRAVLDHRTDIYSLGITMYELLTGRPAFSGQDRASLLQQVLEAEPRPPRRIKSDIPKDLETVVLKSIAKDADDRYASAAELALDLGRFLENKPVAARRASRPERAWRWARRNPIAAVTYSLLLGLLVFLAVAGPLVAFRRATQLKREQRNLYVARINMAYQAREVGDFDRVLELLELCRQETTSLADPRGFEWHYLRQQCRRHQRTPTKRFSYNIFGATFSPDGRRAAFSTWDGAVVLCHASDLREIWRAARDTHSPDGHSEWVRAVTFSPDGRWLASTGRDKTVKLWDVNVGRVLASVEMDWEGQSVAFSHGGLLAVGLANQPLNHGFPSDAPTEIMVYRIDRHDADGGADPQLKELCRLEGLSGAVRSVAFSPDGNVLVAGCDDNTVRRWDMTTHTPLPPLQGHNGPVMRVAYSHNGQYLATGGGVYRSRWLMGEIKLWNGATGTLVRSFLGHSAAVEALAFSPDGNRLASGSRDRTIRLWDTRSGQLLDVLRGHSDGVSGIDFSPDGSQLISGGHDNAVKLWSVEQFEPAELRDAHVSDVLSIAFSHDGKSVVTASADCHVKVWSTDTGELLRELPAEDHGLHFVAASPDGRHLATGGFFMHSGAAPTDITVWDMTSGQVQFRRDDVGGDCILGAFSVDGTVLATAGASGKIILWNPSTGERIRVIDGHDVEGSRLILGLEFSADGRFLVSSSTAGEAKVWSTDDFRCVGTFTSGDDNTYYGAALSDDGTLLAVGGTPNSGVTLWSVATHKVIGHLKGHSDSVLWVDFSLDGRRLASAGKDQVVKLWDLETHNELMTFREHRGWVWRVRFSPDGLTLASCDSSGQLCLRRAGRTVRRDQ